jgi:hypothetical protein
MITIQKVTSYVQSVLRQSSDYLLTRRTVLEERVRYSTVRIQNVFCDGHGKWLKLFKIFLRVFYTVIIRCTETFWSPCLLRHNYSSKIRARKSEVPVQFQFVTVDIGRLVGEPSYIVSARRRCSTSGMSNRGSPEGQMGHICHGGHKRHAAHGPHVWHAW